MKIAIGGNYKIACEAIDYLLEIGISKHDILVCTNKNDQEMDGWQPSLKKSAKRLNLQIVQLEELYDIEDLVFISLEFDQIIKTQKFNSSNLFNIHFSLLPLYKGVYTSCLPLLNGDKVSGVTLHKIDDGIDTGEILTQTSFPLPLDLNGYGLFTAYMNNAVNLFKSSIKNILSNNFTFKPQESVGSTYFSRKSLDFSNIKIDFRQSAYQVHNQIRAFSFRPFQLVKIDDFTVSHSVISENRSIVKPGQFAQISNSKRTYSTIDYDVYVYADRLNEILDAAKDNNLAFIQERHEEGFSFSEKNSQGWDALIVATYHNSIDVVKFLVDVKANLNSVNNNGTSVLMYAMTQAVTSNDFRSMEYLIKHGSKIDHCDYSGKSLLEYAEDHGNISVLNFLKNI
ncbi:methionyl-tRNA formyltransferase [Algoriphagus ratkowskyi]|uniref:Methionyl-tRNA formyltransferase n=1 Tax=Algoriphagus ratkowskyi TaxID=57028 RepID=A0A2W7RA21_9BACT|nr:ankyrin repeat domain-containing protein [Algoriphagus ratkowskyi]PZX57788.1 methionyl-tRNA formyltransferase [Algoriphagus ratkowskyi]TXD79052.1 hypothetical protein ESW18_05920 [Algoriphagus ratkowskyi]